MQPDDITDGPPRDFDGLTDAVQVLLRDAHYAGAAGKAMDSLIAAGFDSVLITKEIAGGMQITAMASVSGRRRVVSGVDLLDCISGVLDGKPRKRCQQCDLTKPITEFAVWASRKGKRWHNCRECEKQRHKEKRARRKHKGE